MYKLAINLSDKDIQNIKNEMRFLDTECPKIDQLCVEILNKVKGVDKEPSVEEACIKFVRENY